MIPNKSVALEKPKSLSEQVFSHIKRMILSEEIKGGEHIPEERIAQAFGVSRTPIREALRKLEKFGLVKIIPHSHAEVVKVGPEDRKHIGEVRIQMEELTTRLLAAKASDDECSLLYALAEACGSAARDGDIAAVFERDSEFHLVIADLSGNPYARDIIKSLNVKVQLLRTTYCTTLEKISKDIRMHGPIIDAIRAHDPPRAASLMRQHLQEVYL
jgi:DNA-binding GntR family transcriptional regulator